MSRFIISVVALVSVAGLANAQLYGISSDGKLFTLSTTNATTTLVGGGGLTGNQLGSLEYNAADDSFWSLDTGGSPSLHKINRADGSHSIIGSTGLPFAFEGALQLAPDGALYGANGGSSNAAQLFKVNGATGAASIIGTLPGNEHDINGLAWRSDNLLVGLDRLGNSLISIDPSTLAVNLITALPFTVGVAGGMANIDFGSAYLINESKDLYQVDLFTGATTLIGTADSAANLRGLAYVVPGPSTALMALGFLAAGRRRR